MELFPLFFKVVTCSGVFYLLYYFLFSKLTFFTWNRWYLLFSLLASLVIPLMHFQVQHQLPLHTSIPVQISALSGINEAENNVKAFHKASNHIDFGHIITFFYLFIAGFMLFRVVIGTITILYKAIKNGQKADDYFLIANASKSNSSFFNLIFLKDDKIAPHEKEQILAHELQHMQLWHSADKLFAEMLKAIFWFNPFMYMIAKELRQVHEFEVDRRISNNYKSIDYANLLLKLSFPVNGLNLINQFSAYGVKSRIRMLFKKHSSAGKKLRYALALPLLVILAYQFSVEKSYASMNTDRNFVLILDAGHGGQNAGAICGKNYLEKDITLALTRQIKAIAEKRGIHTLLTRNSDADVLFKDRVSYNGDVFASIHVNAAPAGPLQQQSNGIEVSDNPFGKSPVLSAQIAEQLKNSFRQLGGINTNDSTFTNPGVYVLRENKLPAVVIECGYATNPNDLNYILNEHKRYELAEKFVDAIIAYKNNRKSL